MRVYGIINLFLSVISRVKCNIKVRSHGLSRRKQFIESNFVYNLLNLLFGPL